MAKKKITLHMYESTSQYTLGARSVNECDFRGVSVCMKDMIWIGSTEVEIDFPEIDTRQIQIDELESQIIAERGQAEARVNLLLDRISKLKAISHAY